MQNIVWDMKISVPFCLHLRRLPVWWWLFMPGIGGRVGMKHFIPKSVSYTHLRAHETQDNLVCRLLLEKNFFNDTATTEIYTMAVVGSVRCV